MRKNGFILNVLERNGEREKMTTNKKCTRYYSSRQEKNVAKAIQGKQTANSGATRFGAGDVLTDNFLIECKTCMEDKQSFSIKKEWLEKNKEEAFAVGKDYSALAFNFGPNSANYYVIDEKLFKLLNECLKEAEE